MDYRDEIADDERTIYHGMIQLYVETNDKSFTLDYSEFWDYENSEESKCAFLESLIEEVYISIWKRVDLDKGEWKENMDDVEPEQDTNDTKANPTTEIKEKDAEKTDLEESTEFTLVDEDYIPYWNYFDYRNGAWYLIEEWLKEFPYLKELFEKWESCTMLDKPMSINKIELSVYFEDIGNEESGPLLFGMVFARIEKEGMYIEKDMLGDCETYHDEKSKKETANYLMQRLEDLMERELDYEGYKDFWEFFDIEKADWKLKEGWT